MIEQTSNEVSNRILKFDDLTDNSLMKISCKYVIQTR